MQARTGRRLLAALLVVGIASPAAAQGPLLGQLEAALAEIQAVRDAALTRVVTYELATKSSAELLTCSSTGALIVHAAVTPKAFGGASGVLRATPHGAVQPSLYPVLGPLGLTFGAAAGESLQLEVQGEIVAQVTVRTTEGAGPPCLVE